MSVSKALVPAAELAAGVSAAELINTAQDWDALDALVRKYGVEAVRLCLLALEFPRGWVHVDTSVAD